MLEFLKALLTPVIALVATYIAWQQWKSNQLKVKHDLYDRRFKVYEEVQKILAIVLSRARASGEDLEAFRRSVAQADFLFGPEIEGLIDQIYRRCVELEYRYTRYRDYTEQEAPGYNHQQISDGIEADLRWLREQFDTAKKNFKPYLDISGR